MPYQTLTLGDLLARFATRYESSPFYAAASATFAIQEALRLWNLFTAISRTTLTPSTVVDDPYLDLSTPTQILTITRVRRTADLKELAPYSLAGLDLAFPGWEAHTTLTSPIAAAPVYWAPAGMGRLAIYPKDTTVLAGGNGPRSLAVDVIACANLPVALTDFLDLGDEDLNALLGYALHVLSFAKGGPALAATHPLYRAFIQAAADRNAVFAASSLYRRIIGQDWTRLAFPLRAQSSQATSARREGVTNDQAGAAGAAGATEGSTTGGTIGGT